MNQFIMKTPDLISNDPYLKPFEAVIINRLKKAENKEIELTGEGSLGDFANGYMYFGLHKEPESWVFREWAPNASSIYLIGVFTDWREQSDYQLTNIGEGVWEIRLALEKLSHGDLYKLSVHWQGGSGDRIPAWVNRVIQDEETKIFSAQVWAPDDKYNWEYKSFRETDEAPLIYEAHVGMASENEEVSTYRFFRDEVLPRIKKAEYNTIQLMAIQEHPYYGSFGYHVSSFFAPSSRFGTPEDLKSLIDTAHGMGLRVIMDLVHSHTVKNVNEGLGLLDGDPTLYFHDEPRREHPAWDSLCFDYGKNEVCHFLLSNCKYWLEEFNFDGFRFDGVTSMLYYDHGLSRDFTSYNEYFDGGQDEDAITYMVLANKLIHGVKPGAISVAEEMSGMPGLATPVQEGGFGFDFRLAMGTPDYWIKIIKEKPDELWNVGEIYFELSNHRSDEKTISYAESHDQALVGDKTILFRLLDRDIYFNMAKNQQSLVVDRGIALHKMIRLATLSTAGGGYLNFMGNEFGHPEWIDFPREGNDWSYKYARRQWSLEDNPDLRYKGLAAFDLSMIRLIKNENCLAEAFPFKYFDNEHDQVLAFQRGPLLFVFNFNPVQSFTGYGIPVPQGKYQLVLDSDEESFDGFGRLTTGTVYYSQKSGKITSSHPYYIQLYLPNRTALVFKKLPRKKIY